jgi:hypothetical protein
MQDGVGSLFPLGVGDLGTEQEQRLGVDHGAEVLHRAMVEIRHPQLVILGQRVADPELLVEEVKALTGHFVQIVDIEVLGHRGPAEVAQVDAVVFPAYLVERAGAQGGDVGAHPYRLLEVDCVVGIAGVDRGDRSVGDHPPLRRHQGVPREHALEVGLVETGEDPLGVGDLELAVQIYPAVDRVDAAGEPLPGLRVTEVGVDQQGVLLGQLRQRQASLGRPAAQIQSAPIQRGRAHLIGGEFDERLGARFPATEPDLGDRPEPALAGEVEGDVVRGHVEQSRPLDRLPLGQVPHSGHRLILLYCWSAGCGASITPPPRVALSSLSRSPEHPAGHRAGVR